MNPKFYFNKIFVAFAFLLILSVNVMAQTTYYVSSTGSDLANGQSTANAWKTLSKVNASMASFVSGDQILFKKGDTFYGQLKISTAGITIGAYGSGDNPVISGAQQITSTWATNGNSIWFTTVAGNPAEVNKVFVNDVAQPISRYPNKNVNNGYLNFESSSGTTSITDNQLTGSLWADAHVVVRTQQYRLVKVKVLTQSGGTVTWAPNADISTLINKFGYFFTNDKDAIDQNGEWAYDAAGVLHIRATSNPGTTVSYSKTDTVVVLQNAHNVVIDGIDIKQANKTLVSITGSNNTIVRNCNITESGGGGVYYNNAPGATLEYNAIKNVSWNGVSSLVNSNTMIIKNNNFRNMGDEAYGKQKTFYGIYCESDYSQITNNTIKKAGLAGIITAGMGSTIKRNVVDSVLLFGMDMGAIYTNYNINNNEGTIIEENIVTNGFGEYNGAPVSTDLAQGIYLDNFSTDVIVRNNTAAYFKGACYYINASRTGNTVTGNTAFNKTGLAFWQHNPNVAPELALNNNIFVTSNKSQSKTLAFFNTGSYTIDQLGVTNTNYFVNPFNPRVINLRYLEGSLNKEAVITAYEFESFFEDHYGNFGSPIKYDTTAVANDVIKFYYNTSNVPKSYTLPAGNFIDAKNEPYCGTLNLDPYTSVILFRVNTSSCATPSACTNPTGVTATNITDIEATINWTGHSSSTNYDIRYRIVGETNWKYAGNILKTLSTFKLLNLSPSETYEWQMRSSCYGAEGNWSSLNTFTTDAGAPNVAPSAISTQEEMGSSLQLKWEPVRTAESYNLQYKVTGAGSWIQKNNLTETFVYLGNLAPSTTYDYQLQSNFAGQTSAWSSTATFTTLTGGEVKRLYARASDANLYRNESEITERDPATSMFVGRINNGQSGNAVYPFRIPVLSSGQSFREVDFNVRLKTRGAISSDLWGMNYRSLIDTVQLADYYDGEEGGVQGANQATATLLQTDWVNGSLLAGSKDITSSQAGRTAIKTYFLNQYNNSPAPNGLPCYTFLRINPAYFSDVHRLIFDGIDDNDFYKPFIHLVLSPKNSTIPAAASSVSVSNNGTTNSLDVQWTDNSSNESGFLIERRLSNGTYDSIAVAAANATSAIITGLPGNNTTFFIRVLAYNQNGSVGYSNEASATTSIAGVTTLDAKVANLTSVNVTWTDYPTETGYILERKQGSGAYSVIEPALPANTVSYRDNGLTTNATYTYRLKGVFSSGESTYSNEATITVFAVQFTPGNIVVSQIGDGNTSALAGTTALPVSLIELTTTGDTTGTIVNLNSGATGTRLTLPGNGSSNAWSEGDISLSADRRYIVLAGYNIQGSSPMNLGVTNPVQGTIAKVDFISNDVYDVTMNRGVAFRGSNVRSVTSIDGSSYWVSGGGSSTSSPIRYFTSGQSNDNGAEISATTNVTSTRGIGIFNNQLYISSGSASYYLNTVGSGVPTTSGNSVTNLPGFPVSNTSAVSFVLLDADSTVAGPDLLYVATLGSVNSANYGIRKFSFNGTTWTARGAIYNATGYFARSLTAKIDSGVVKIYALVATATNIRPTMLYKFTDATAYNATISNNASALSSGTLLYASGSGYAFGGVAFSPLEQASSGLLTVKNKEIVSLIDEKTTEFLVYPNPSDGLYTIKTDLIAVALKVYNAAGIKVEDKLYDSLAGTLIVDIRNQPTGIYFLEIKDNLTGKTHRLKLIKQ